MISVICAYNNKDLLDSMLIESLKKQSFQDFELILINSKELGFKSASEALNYGASISKGDILVFSHQDIQLLDENAFQKIKKFCEENDFGLGCVAGVSVLDNKVYSSVMQGLDKKIAGERAKEIKEIDGADECFFFVKKEDFKSFANLGDTWHLYAVEYSIKCKISNEKVILLPISIYHLSTGLSGIDDSYWNTLIILGNLYKNRIKYIPTVFGFFSTKYLIHLQIPIKKFFVRIREKSINL